MTRPGRLPRLHVLVPDAAAARPDFERAARQMLRRGRGEVALHLRLRETSGRTLHRLARSLAGTAREEGGWCVVNGRVDVALAAGADAVQLGRSAMPVPVVRELVGVGTALGASVHGADEGVRAEREGANFLVLGTIFDSPSHPDIAGSGPGRVDACAGRVSVPVVAIGGMSPDRVRPVREAGATGVATLSGVWDAPDPVEAASAFLDALGAADPPERRDRGREDRP